MKKIVDYFEKLDKNNKITHSFLIGNVFYDDIKEELEEIINKILLRSKMKISENPDVYILENKEEKISKDDIKELLKNVNKTSQFHNNKVYIIENVENLNDFACNALLKTLEEPPLNVYAILLTSNIIDVKDTISSRCQKIFINSETKETTENEKAKEIALNLKQQLEEYNCKIITKNYKIYSIIEDRNLFVDILKELMNLYKNELDDLLKEKKYKEAKKVSNIILIVNNHINKLNYPLNKNMTIDGFIIEIGRCLNENS